MAFDDGVAWRMIGVMKIAGDIWEHAALLAVKSQDEAAFERSYLQLRNYYIDARSVPHLATDPQIHT